VRRTGTSPWSHHRFSDDSLTPTYLPNLEYDYTVAGREHRGDCYEFIERGRGNRLEIESIIDRYPVGSELTVHYDPDDPGSSVIKRGEPAAMGIPFFLGFVAIIVGGVIVLAMRPAEKPYVPRRRRSTAS